MAEEGLPKSHLVRKGWEYQQIYRQGKRLHSQGFSLICLGNGGELNRLGISIHRKLRGAAKRNRIKRIIREAFRRNRELFPKGKDIVVTVRPDFSLTTPAEICAEVARLVQNAHESPRIS